MILKGKHALITGTGGGIGAAIAEEFARNGCDIIAHARKETPQFTEFLSKIEKQYPVHIQPVFFDMTDYAAMKETMRQLMKETAIDILVNNAGVNHSGLFQMTPVSKIREIFETNLFSHMELTQMVLKKMTRQKSGVIINLASTAGLQIRPGNSAYGVSKAAVIAWTKTLAYELGNYHIRVNAIAPGLTNTKMGQKVIAETIPDELERNVLGQILEPADIARAALFLASENAGFVNGQVLAVDGGVAG